MTERPTRPEAQGATEPGGRSRERAAESTELGVRRHFPATDDGLAVLLLLSLVLYVGFDGLGVGGFSFGNTNPAVLGVYLTIVGVASTWAFGKRAVETWRSGSGAGVSQP